MAAEHVDPLLLGVLEGIGDEVGWVGLATAGHGDVRLRGIGAFTDQHVRGSTVSPRAPCTVVAYASSTNRVA